MATATATGQIAQVIGSTFDAEFDEGHLPEIYNALKVEAEEKGVKINLTGEVQQPVDDEMRGVGFERDSLLRRLAGAGFERQNDVAQQLGRAIAV